MKKALRIAKDHLAKAEVQLVQLQKTAATQYSPTLHYATVGAVEALRDLVADLEATR